MPSCRSPRDESELTMTWTLTDQQAHLTTRKLSAVFDLCNPKQGWQTIVFGQETLRELKPVQVTAHPPVSQETIIESYIRGDDLVTTYAQLPERTVRPQLHFRDLAASLEDSCAGVEMVVAVQTSLLDSDPTFSLVTEVNSKEVYGLKHDEDWDAVDTGSEREIAAELFTGGFVFRLADCDVSYAELVFPADFQGARLTGGEAARLSYQIFPEFLEKGVIRKGRIWSVLLPQQGDLEAVKSIYQQMQIAPPPLTV
jgi:hypothetical protein